MPCATSTRVFDRDRERQRARARREARPAERRSPRAVSAYVIEAHGMNVPCARRRHCASLTARTAWRKTMTLAAVNHGTIDANGAQLYYEARGHGPAVLFISGATGDAGHFEAAAERLAGQLTPITYDRRPHPRRPPPHARTRAPAGGHTAAAPPLAGGLAAPPGVRCRPD